MISSLIYIFSRFFAVALLLLILLLSSSSFVYAREPIWYELEKGGHFVGGYYQAAEHCLSRSDNLRTHVYAGKSFYCQKSDGTIIDTYKAKYNQPPSQENCSISPPITASNKLSVGCHNGCQYQYQTELKNWENALAETEYEYLTNGSQCNNEPTLRNAKEYTDTSESGLLCSKVLDLTTCLLDNGCKSYNGVHVCNTSETDYVCGTYNDTVTCYDKNQKQNCGMVNGSPMCVDSDYNIIPSTSPDNPINGGNGDGNESNDVFSKDEIENNSAAYSGYQDELKKSIARQIAEESLDSDSSEETPVFEIPDKYSDSNSAETSIKNYYTGLSEVPLIRALNISPSVTNDNCPPLQFDDLPFVGSQGTNIHCDLIDDNRSALETLFKAIWIIAGIFIIFMG